MKNGDIIKIIWLTSCRNGRGSINPYIGMQGTVHDFNGKRFTFLLVHLGLLELIIDGAYI